MLSTVITIIISVAIFGITIFFLVKKILEKKLSDFMKNTKTKKKLK